jgi:hypothetical protein
MDDLHSRYITKLNFFSWNGEKKLFPGFSVAKSGNSLIKKKNLQITKSIQNSFFNNNKISFKNIIIIKFH